MFELLTGFAVGVALSTACMYVGYLLGLHDGRWTEYPDKHHSVKEMEHEVNKWWS